MIVNFLKVDIRDLGKDTSESEHPSIYALTRIPAVKRLIKIADIPNPILEEFYFGGENAHIYRLVNGDSYSGQVTWLTSSTSSFSCSMPLHMLKINRKKLSDNLTNEKKEKAALMDSYLGRFCATSIETIDDAFVLKGKRTNNFLCGLQEYVQGYDFYPLSESDYLRGLNLKESQGLVDCVKKLILEQGIIPNLWKIMYDEKNNVLKVVDLYDVRKVYMDEKKGEDDEKETSARINELPLVDMSVLALARIEEKIKGSRVDMTEKIYDYFLNPERCLKAKQKIEEYARIEESRINSEERMRCFLTKKCIKDRCNNGFFINKDIDFSKLYIPPS